MTRNIEHRDNDSQEGSHSLPKVIIYAGESHRRKAFLANAFPKATLETFSVEPEPETTDVKSIVEYKLDLGVERSLELGLNGQRDNAIIVAADIRTLTPFEKKGEEVELRSTSKLENYPAIWGNLQRMRKICSGIEDKPFYIVDIASGYHSLADNNRQIQRDHCLIILDPDGFYYLTRYAGFKDYLERFSTFYSEPPYSTHGLPPIRPTDISAGLSLPVLTEMGIVESIDGIDRESDQFTQAFLEGLYKVGVGFNAPTLTSFHPDIAKTVAGWSWNNQVAEKVLE